MMNCHRGGGTPYYPADSDATNTGTRYSRTGSTPSKCALRVLLLLMLSAGFARKSDAQWQTFGPAPQYNGAGSGTVSGRTVALAWSPNYDGQGTPAMFLGAAGGGVWRSTDYSAAKPTWIPLTDNLGLSPTVEAGAIDVGCITVDPFHPNIVYVGTGEPHFSLDSRYGAGILKSTDGGNTWTIPSPTLTRTYISRIIVDPTDTSGNTLYASTTGTTTGATVGSGVFKSTDAGKTWIAKSASMGSGASVTDLDYTLSPTGALSLWATVGSPWGSTANGLWKSLNGGTTWVRGGSGLPLQSIMGRMALAADHTPGPAPMVALLVTYNSTVTNKGGTLENIYTSCDGNAFTTCTYPGNLVGSQGWYDISFGLSPEGVIYAAGVSYPTSQMGVYQTADYGQTWTAIDQGTNGLTPHTDHHFVTFVGGLVYDTCDGGVYRFTPITGQTHTFKPGFKAASVTDPEGVAVTDVTGDGKPDIVTLNRSPKQVLVSAGNGNGTFASATSYSTGANPLGMLVTDVTGDASPDILVTNETDNTVSVFVNTGLGIFTAQPAVPVAGDPVSIAAGDFNGDNITDLAVSCNSGTVSILIGNGDGTFTAGTPIATDAPPYGIATSRLAGDANFDLVIAEPSAHSVVVYRGNGDGTFPTKATYPVSGAPTFVTVTDINGDTKPDIIVPDPGSSLVYVMLGADNAAFGAPVGWTASPGSTRAQVADVTGDGKLDLVVTGGSSNVMVLVGDGHGAFASRLSYAARGAQTDAAVVDVNGDGLPDVVMAQAALSNVNVLFNTIVQGKAGRGPWESLNTTGLQTIQCIGVGQHPTDPNIVLEGSQDNGTARRSTSTGNIWNVVYGGDGGLNRYDPANGNYAYRVAPQGSVGSYAFFGRSSDGGLTWTGDTNGISKDTTFPGYGGDEDGNSSPRWLPTDSRDYHAMAPPPYAGRGSGRQSSADPITETAFPFYPIFALNPANATRLVIGSTIVYETKNRGDLWTPISAALDGTNVVSALAYGPSADGTIYAAYSDGALFRTVNDVSWTRITGTQPWGSNAIRGIVVDPRNASVLYVGTGAFGNNVYRSDNGGTTWINATGDLPHIPVNALAMDPRTVTPTIYAGTDIGVWQSVDKGLHWVRFGTGLPNAQVFDMDLNTNLNRLAVGTHGRGVYVIPLDNTGTLGIADAILILQSAAGLRTTSPTDLQSYDLTAPVGVDILDAVYLIRHLNGFT